MNPPEQAPTAGAAPDGAGEAWPRTSLSRQAVVGLAYRLEAGPQHPDKCTQRARGADRLLGWLETWPGPTWQQRWHNSGAERCGRGWAEAPARFIHQTAATGLSEAGSRHTAVVGLNALLCLGVLRPGYAFLLACRLQDTFGHIRALADPEFFAAASAFCEKAGHRERHRLDALHHLCRVVMHTGRGPRQLRPEDLLAYHAEVVAVRQAKSIALSWELLRELKVFPEGTPCLRDARKAGRRSVAELVDGFGVQSEAVRDLLVRYLGERAAAGIDYNTLTGLVGDLVGAFWKDVEAHHPGIDSLQLAPEAAQAWRERALLQRRPGAEGATRADPYHVLFAVRAFYLDIAQWALEDPYWARWAAPSPVRAEHVRGWTKHKRRRQARMHQRTRTLAPLLPQLVHSVESRLRDVERLHRAAAEAAVGTTFTLDGEQYERTQASSDARPGAQAGARRLRVRRCSDGQPLDLTRDEDEAFWTWAVVEVLRHSGVRIEEMLELTHLALVTHRLPDTGEVVPLLQVVPSKADAERVLLVSPELAHVLARIVHRIRGGKEHVPLVARYDPHERVTGPPLPHLFQRRHGTDLRVISTTAVHRLLGRALDRAGLRGPDGTPLRYTPHDFRRVFATEAVAAGLPVHIAAKLLGHQDLNTTQIYAAVYQDDVLRHHAAFLARRRAARPGEEYRDPTPTEWAEFERHFTRRKIELGTCARPYGTPCRHEHACLTELILK